MPADQRQRDLAAIHMGRKSLELDDDTYRLLLEGVTGKRSAGDLGPAERARVLDKMRELGFQRAPKRRAAPQTHEQKARALWRRLGEQGALRDHSTQAFQSFVERQTGKSRVEWCTPDELNSVIEALKAWLARHRSSQ